MIIALIILFGAVVGIIAHNFYGSGYSLWWDIFLGMAGSVLGSFIITVAYVFNLIGDTNFVGLTWYGAIAGTAGSLALIYSASLYYRAHSITV